MFIVFGIGVGEYIIVFVEACSTLPSSLAENVSAVFIHVGFFGFGIEQLAFVGIVGTIGILFDVRKTDVLEEFGITNDEDVNFALCKGIGVVPNGNRITMLRFFRCSNRVAEKPRSVGNAV